MAFGKAVAGKFIDQLKDKLSFFTIDTALDRTFDETGFLLVHFRLDFLAHGTTQ